MKKEKIKRWLRTFKHNIECIDGYDKKVLIILLSLLLIDLVVLYLVW
jgi:hypothetical protein